MAAVIPRLSTRKPPEDALRTALPLNSWTRDRADLRVCIWEVASECRRQSTREKLGSDLLDLRSLPRVAAITWKDRRWPLGLPNVDSSQVPVSISNR